MRFLPLALLLMVFVVSAFSQRYTTERFTGHKPMYSAHKSHAVTKSFGETHSFSASSSAHGDLPDGSASMIEENEDGFPKGLGKKLLKGAKGLGKKRGSKGKRSKGKRSKKAPKKVTAKDIQVAKKEASELEAIKIAAQKSLQAINDANYTPPGMNQDLVEDLRNSKEQHTDVVSRQKKLQDEMDDPEAMSHLGKLVDDVASLSRARTELFQDLKKDKIEKYGDWIVAQKDILKRKRVKPAPSFVQVGKSDSDVIDCVACRFAWFKVEMNLSDSYVPKNLYDAFVTICSEIQLGQLFFKPCNDMFAKIDAMVGDYMYGFTVNQMCENAQMCR